MTKATKKPKRQRKKLSKAEQTQLELMVLNGLSRFKSIAREAGLGPEDTLDVIQDCNLYIIQRYLRSGTKSRKGTRILDKIHLAKAGTYFSRCVSCRSHNLTNKRKRHRTRPLEQWHEIQRKF